MEKESNKTSQKTFNVLVVEDDAADRKLIARLFEACSVQLQLHFARDGEEAADFLFKRNQFQTVPVPDLILLDLNMPKKDGREFLEEVKADPQLKAIPVVVLTTSSSDIDICRAYLAHVNSYIQKPRDLDQFQQIIKLIELYWLTVVKLPRGNARIG